MFSYVLAWWLQSDMHALPSIESCMGHACRYNQQVKQLQQEQRDIQRDSDSFGYSGHEKHIGNPDDRKLAVKHNKTLIEVAKASLVYFKCIVHTCPAHAPTKHAAFNRVNMLLLAMSWQWL